jgi:spermidine synthase
MTLPADRTPEPATPTSFFWPALLFFVSGFAALVYEISWTRQLGVLFGHTTQAAGIVLASYFGGMATGYWIGARLCRRVSPLLGYAVAEAIVAVWAILFPWLLAAAAQAPAVESLLHSGGAGQTLARAALALLLLLPATTALGATLPFFAEFVSPRHGFPKKSLTDAYAWNTLGAFVGVLAAISYLIVFVGVRASSYAAAGLSMSCAIVAWWIDRRVRFRRTGTPARPAGELDSHSVSAPSSTTGRSARPTEAASARMVYWLAALSGLTTLALEVLYTRLFSLVFHNSTHTFALVVAVFLLALSLGAFLSGRLLERFPPQSIIFGAAVAGGLAIIASVCGFVLWTRFEYLRLGPTFVLYLVRSFGLVAAIVMVPCTCLGMILPAIWRLAMFDDSDAGRHVGRLTMVNTLCAAGGSLAASFWFLPALGVWRSFGVILLLVTAISLIVRPIRLGSPAMTLQILMILASVPLWASASSTGAVRHGWLESFAKPNLREELVRRWETSYGWVDVTREPATNVMRIRQNLHYSYGSTGDDASREHRQAHLPLLIHPAPRDALFLGLGTGVTAAGVIAHRELQSTTVVELIPEVVDAVRMLSAGNDAIADRDGVKVAVDDARHFLATTDQKFDVIVSDLFVPWESSTGYLYTAEHYRAAHRRLKPGGVFCQWLALYQVGERELDLIANSLAAEFPHVTLWWGRLSSSRPMIAMIATDEPIRIDDAVLTPRLNDLRATGRYHDELITSPSSLYELWFADWPRVAGAQLNTEEHPRVEFWCPASHGNREMLTASRLRDFLDRAAKSLPREVVMFEGNDPASSPRDPSWQKTVLFPE